MRLANGRSRRIDPAQDFLRSCRSGDYSAERLCAPACWIFAIPPAPNVAITYCRLCNWLLRAAWMGQELLSTFAEELGSVTLIPDDTGGVFEIRIDGKLIWSRAGQGRFPEIKELKQIVRDEIAPERDLGHVDKKEDET
jgi:selenoprotein W-related protein